MLSQANKTSAVIGESWSDLMAMMSEVYRSAREIVLEAGEKLELEGAEWFTKHASLEEAMRDMRFATLSDCGANDAKAAREVIPEKLREFPEEVNGAADEVVYFKCMLHLISNLVNQLNIAIRDVEVEINELLLEVNKAVESLNAGIFYDKEKDSLVMKLGYLMCKVLHARFDHSYNKHDQFIGFLREWNEKNGTNFEVWCRFLKTQTCD